MKRLLLFICILTFAGCSSFPSKKIVEEKYFLSDAPQAESYESMKKKLSVGVNMVGAGYSAEVYPLTRPLIVAEEAEAGKKNLDSTEVVQQKTKARIDAFSKDRTCFSITIDTYDIETAKFTNWRAKLSSNGDALQELQFLNTKGVQSVPTPFKDFNGRDWHNNSLLCSSKVIDLRHPIKIILIPQFETNLGSDANAELSWEIKK